MQDGERPSLLAWIPADICPDRCKARVWNGGRGGQCQNRPSNAGDLCAGHARFAELPHGRIDGPIPERKLEDFMKALRRAAKPGVLPHKAKCRPAGKPHWYARSIFWEIAVRLASQNSLSVDAKSLCGIEDLSDVDFDACLACTDQWIAQRPLLRGKAAGYDLERDAGPCTSADRHDPCLVDYNGKNGGKRFRHYALSVFQRELSKYGVTPQSCDEKQCFLALTATDDAMARSALRLRGASDFRGPQCFPHLQDTRRVGGDGSAVEFQVRQRNQACINYVTVRRFAVPTRLCVRNAHQNGSWAEQ
jgi:hypothetical protein